MLNEKEREDNRKLMQAAFDLLKKEAKETNWPSKKRMAVFDFCGYYRLEIHLWIEEPSRSGEKWCFSLGIVSKGHDVLRSNYLCICPTKEQLVKEMESLTVDVLLDRLDTLILRWIQSDDD